MPSNPPDAPPISSLAGAVTALEDEQQLRAAFRSFAEVSASLEHSYARLRSEVERLTCELAESHSGLARSLEENRGMRVHLDRILEGLPCGVLVASAAGKILRLNPEAHRLLQLSAGTAGPPNPAIAGELSALSAGLRQLLETARDAGGEKETCLSDEPGSAVWLAARHAPLADVGGDGTSVFILRDISQDKRLEIARQKLRREQALAEMSAVLAHEVRNPLASLELFAGLLAESPLDGERLRWIGQMQAGLRTLAATVNNVLHFHGVPEPERSSLDLGELLDGSLDFLTPLARQAGIVLSRQNQIHGVRFSADRHQLEQVLLNLVLNSIRAMPGGGWIELRGRRSAGGDTVTLEVADTGPGISEEHRAGIFEAGFSTRAGGPGLGLAVSRKIVEQHGGAIAVTSRAGAGAVFTITFALAGSKQQQNGGAAA